MLAQVRIARSRLAGGASDLKRAQRSIADFQIPGRLPAIAATVERDLTTARANARNHDVVEEPSAPELAVLRCLAAGLWPRAIGERLYILNAVKTHTRQLYRTPAQVRGRTRSRNLKRRSA